MPNSIFRILGLILFAIAGYYLGEFLVGIIDSDLNPLAGFSINFWINARTLSVISDRVVLSAYEDSQNGFKIIHNDANYIEAFVKVGGTEYSVAHSTVVAADTWEMYTVWHQVSSPFIRIAKNADIISSIACPAAIPSYESKLSVGGLGSGTGFDGGIQMISLHNLELSAAERTWLYRSAHGRVYAELSGEFEVESTHRPVYKGDKACQTPY